MTVRPDRKFYSMYALRKNYKKLQKSKEHIIISSDCFWTVNNDISMTYAFLYCNNLETIYVKTI